MRSELSPVPASGNHDALNQRLCLLIGRATAGDTSAFDEMYTCTARMLLSRIRVLAGDSHAEDILADVYVQVWRSLDTFDPMRSPPSAWMTMIARTRALDHLRAEKSRQDPARFDRCADGGECDGPEDLCIRVQDVERVHDALATLDGDERLVVGLAFFRELTQLEIAAETGLPPSSVRALMARGQRKLKVRLSAAASAPMTQPGVQGSP